MEKWANRKGKLFVISGPSGVGKGTICKEAVKESDIVLSVSMTTREKRPEEVDGESYYFVTKEDFLKEIENDGLLEYAYHFSNYYGTPKKAVLEEMKKGHDIILEIDIKGAFQIKKKFSEAVLVFILPPSLDVLKKRIRLRGSESLEQIESRLKHAEFEMTKIKRYDYYIINDDLDEAVSELKAIIKAEKCKVSNINSK